MKSVRVGLGCCIGCCGLCSVEEFQHLVPELLVWGVGFGIYSYYKKFQVFNFLNPVASRQKRITNFLPNIFLSPVPNKVGVQNEI
jgi:hypothetical protein